MHQQGGYFHPKRKSTVGLKVTILIAAGVLVVGLGVLYFHPPGKRLSRSSLQTTVSRSCHGHGSNLYDEGKFEEAIQAWTNCAFGLDPTSDAAGVQEVQYDLGSANFRLSKYQEAIANLEKVTNLGRQDSEKQNLRAEVFHMRGFSNLWLGSYSESLKWFDQEIDARRTEADNEKLVRALYNKARTCIYLSRYQVAEKTLAEARQIAESSNDASGAALVYLGYGRLYGYVNRLQDAEEFLKWARNPSNDAALNADVYMNVGAQLREKGRYGDALDKYSEATNYASADPEATRLLLPRINVERAMALYRSEKYLEAENSVRDALPKLHANEDKRYEIMGYAALGQTLSLSGRPEKALEPYTKALELLDHQEDRLLRAQVANNAALVLMDVGDFSLAEERFRRAAEDFEEARSDLPDSESRRRFMGNLPMIYGNWAAINIYQNRIREAFEILERGRAKSLIDLLETSHASSKSALHEDLSLGLRSRMSSVKYEQLVAPLDDDTTLVEYFHGGRMKIKGETREELWIFVVTKKEIGLEKLPVDESRLNATMMKYLEYSYGFFDIPVSGTALNKCFVDPVADKIRTRNLVIVPWKGMFYMPLSAFWSAAIDPINVSIIPSALSLKYILENRHDGRNSVVICANPSGTGPSLEGAETEGRRIRSLFSAPRLYVKKEATESMVKKLQPLPDVLHFATHGFYDPYNPLKSFVSLAADSQEDGALTAEEVFDLNFKGVSLVTLSACQTGMSRLYFGDDNLGLLQAFFLAGVPSVVASLWNVDDKATEQFMADFYHAYNSGSSKAQAIRQAKQQMQQYDAWHSPIYWAAFQLYGAW